MYSDKDLHFQKEDKDLAELFTKVPPTLDMKLWVSKYISIIFYFKFILYIYFAFILHLYLYQLQAIPNTQ